MQGQARDVRPHSSKHWFWGEEVPTVTFRLERFDTRANQLPLVPVEMKGEQVEGLITEGDHVWVRGPVQRGIVRAKELVNVTGGSSVNASSDRNVMRTIVRTLTVLALVAIFAAIAAAFAIGWSPPGFEPDGPPSGFPEGDALPALESEPLSVEQGRTLTGFEQVCLPPLAETQPSECR
jgi:hypothetical protein